MIDYKTRVPSRKLYYMDGWVVHSGGDHWHKGIGDIGRNRREKSRWQAYPRELEE